MTRSHLAFAPLALLLATAAAGSATRPRVAAAYAPSEVVAPEGWRTVAVSDSVTVAVDMDRVRPFQQGTLLLHMRYDYRVPQGRQRAAEFRLRDFATFAADLRFTQLETWEYSYCGPKRRMTALLHAAFFDAAGRRVAASDVDTRDGRGFPTISGDSAGEAICALRARGELRPMGS